MADPAELAAAVRRGDRAALARAITLVESRRGGDAEAAEALLQVLLPHTGGALRIGVTGAPGVGKSTLIEALGLRLCRAGRRVAVLAVDPSSSVTGGSILGDKTRMVELSRHPGAFVRPSPGGDAHGGVGARTREALLLCEAAGFDVVLVETIGTGQAENAVHAMVDFCLLLLSPAAGDELQGIKRGAMELADGVLVTRADGDLAAAAELVAQQCRFALRVLHGGEPPPPVVAGSARNGTGLDELWRTIEDRLQQARAGGRLQARRAAQAGAWLDAIVQERLLAGFLADPVAAAELQQARASVARGEQLPGAAARQVLARRWVP
ncbi:MAG: methylmalonyl Co-A mutase-associated GTPase MeaB [Planctomycetes bacterium]|nr:methylmalonyl Co-A mutase-associated GTPase MeaB [Planctomycetota bacterium]